VIWLLLAHAQAYDVSGVTWPLEALPVAWTVADDAQDGLSAAECQDAVAAAVALWEDPGCVGPLHAVAGTGSGLEPFGQDGVNTIVWNDPGSRLAAGVLAATIGRSDGALFSFDGEPLLRATEADLVVNDNTEWADEDDCVEGFLLSGVLAHELGHAIGLGHPEDDGADPGEEGALMTGETSWCSVPALSADDRAGVTALFGATPGLDCTDTVGYAPLATTCTVDGRAPELLTSITWDFGDGTTAGATPVDHVYTEPGVYTSSACVEVAADEACWEDCREGPTFVVCPPADPVVTAEPLGGLVYQLRGVDVSVPHCVDDIHWKVSSAEATVYDAYATEPIVAFPSAGSYDVTVTAEGLDGPISATETFDIVETELPPVPDTGDDAEEQRGCGCASSGAPGRWAWIAIVVLAAARRRSRR
jgi:MYXO-CTERM domain-containing protein